MKKLQKNGKKWNKLQSIKQRKFKQMQGDKTGIAQGKVCRDRKFMFDKYV